MTGADCDRKSACFKRQLLAELMLVAALCDCDAVYCNFVHFHVPVNDHTVGVAFKANKSTIEQKIRDNEFTE